MHKELAYSIHMLVTWGGKEANNKNFRMKTFFKLKGFPHKMRYFQYSVRDVSSVGTGQI